VATFDLLRVQSISVILTEAPGFLPPFLGGFPFNCVVYVIEHCSIAGFDPGIGYPSPVEQINKERRVLDQINFGPSRFSLHKLFDPKSCPPAIVYLPALDEAYRWIASCVPASPRSAYMFGVPAMHVGCAAGIVIAVLYLQNVDPVTVQVLTYL
jgi:hypothetical protein